MKIFYANFGVYGSCAVVAQDINEALVIMRGDGGHPDANDIKLERVWDTITEHEITSGLVLTNLGDT